MRIKSNQLCKALGTQKALSHYQRLLPLSLPMALVQRNYADQLTAILTWTEEGMPPANGDPLWAHPALPITARDKQLSALGL